MACPLFLLKLFIRTGLVRYLPGMKRLAEGGADFLHYYSDRVLAAPRGLPPLDALTEPAPPDVIDLSCPAPRIDTPSLNLPRQTDRRGLPPWGLPQLRSAVAERLLADRQLAFSPTDEVLITPGAAGALQTILDTFVNRGDRVTLFDPTSPLFTLALRTHGARARWVFSWVEDGRVRFRLDQLAKAMRGSRLLVMASPSNPAGGVIAEEDLEQIAWWAGRHDVLIVSDECFAPFLYEGDGLSIGSLSQARMRTLTVGSVSKSHGLPALRVGWIAGPRPLLRPCQLSAALRMTSVPALCQQVALAALRQPIEALTTVVAELAAKRRYAFERLQALGLKPAWPVGGFSFWVPVWEMGLSGQEFADLLLARKRVQVTPGELFGPSGLGYVRISFAADEGRLREGLGRIAELLTEGKKAALTAAA